MTIDKSLKVKVGSIRSRNVLTRGERIAKLKEAERWTEGSSVIGLPKVRVFKLSLKKKKKAKAAEEGAAAAGGAAATPAAAGADKKGATDKKAAPAKK
jgi:small basic protein (TIGR04137 family)